MTDKPEVMSGYTLDVAEQRRDELKQLFPGVFTETTDANGDVVETVDFERLKAELGSFTDVYEGRRERYGMDWPGKRDCMKLIQEPTRATLKPSRDDSTGFDIAKNIFIEGDNLEVLKLLQKSYYGKVKMIYIDPPYNTGNEFIYPDNYQESLGTYLAYAGMVDDEGKVFATNTTSEGRFHTKWMNMIYPRVYLSRNLLTDDGVFLASINDKEYNNFKNILDQIFGEENFVASLVWEKGRKNDAKRFSVGHEYILVYAKNLSHIEEIVSPWREPKEGITEISAIYHELKEESGDNYEEISQGIIDFYRELDNDHPSKKYSRSRFVDARGLWRDNNITWPGGGGPKYDVIHPVTGQPCKIPADGWRFVEETMKQKIADGYIHFRKDHSEPPILKSYLYIDPETQLPSEEESGGKLQVMGSVFYRHSQPSNDVVKSLFGEKVFENPKDHEILARLIDYCTSDGDIILDFFSGSASTAHAVMDVNKSTGSSRKFIVVQLPEEVAEDSLAFKKGLKTISELGRERIKRAAIQLNENKDKLDVNELEFYGFKAFSLDSSCFKAWSTADNSPDIEEQLELHVNHVDEMRSQEEILYELLLKAGFELSEEVVVVELAGKSVFSVASGALMICLENEISSDLIDAVVSQEPMQFICLDKGFKGNDQLKANAVQTFKSKSQNSESELVLKVV